MLCKGTALLSEAPIVALATKHGRTPAQIVLRWLIQQGNVVLSKTSNQARASENLAIFDFALTSAEIAAITALDTGAEKRVDSDVDGH